MVRFKRERRGVDAIASRGKKEGKQRKKEVKRDLL